VAVDAAPATVTHTIRSSPSAARVLREPERTELGATPLVGLVIDRDRAEVVYAVEKQGYATQRVHLDAARDHDVVVTLRKNVGKPPPETPKPGSGSAAVSTPPPNTTKPPPQTPKSPVPCRKKGEPPNPFDKKPPCPD
jgi:hypothetical protein